MQNENETYAWLLIGHLKSMVHRLRQIPPDRWDWQPEPMAPSARILAVHTWQWLMCDRQHIAEPDASQHTLVPEPPDEPQALCDALAAETQRWDDLLRSLTPEQLLAPRNQFNMTEYTLNVRWFVAHMIQNSIYKHGQLSMLYFMLGLDGPEPYDAPFPNPIYRERFGTIA